MSQEVDYYKIYVDQLRDGKVEQIDRLFPVELLDVNEADLKFVGDIHVTGEVYQSSDSLVLHLNMNVNGLIPCSICNEEVRVPLSVKGFYHIVPIDEIKGHVFDMQSIVRENTLINTPRFAECDGGDCQQRSTISQYLKRSDKQNEELSEGYQPFMDLK